LSQPHPINHYLYFGDKGDARKAGKLLGGEGYAVDVRRGAERRDWLVLAAHVAVPSPETIAHTAAKMEALAASFRGEYDGWEAQVVR